MAAGPGNDTPAKHLDPRQVLEESRRTRQSTADLLASLARTTAAAEQVRLSSQKTMAKWEGVKADFDRALNGFVERLSTQLGGGPISRPPHPMGLPPPKIAASRDAASIAGFISSSRCKKVAFLTGAGISVSAGIPDFRSPGGMYDTLRPELLTATPEDRAAMADNPTTVVSWGLFERNPLPYLELRRPFILGIANGTWKPTLFHALQWLCHRHGLLSACYSQNIDGLDLAGGLSLPSATFHPVHGSMATASCEHCGSPCPQADFISSVRANIKDIYGVDPAAPKESTLILCKTCGKPGVKPDTVLYGRSLPGSFFESLDRDAPLADLLLVAGTSLTVSPANSAVNKVNSSCVRVLINKDVVGQDLGLKWGEASTDSLDVRLPQEDCDRGAMALVSELGWKDELIDAVAGGAIELAENSLRILRE